MWSRSSRLWKPRGRDSLNLYPNILYLEPIHFPLYISSRQQFPADKLRITRSSLYTRALTIWIPRNRSFMPGEDDFYTRGASLRRVSRIRATTSFFFFFFFFLPKEHRSHTKRSERNRQRRRSARRRRRKRQEKYKENRWRREKKGKAWAITTWLELQRTPSLLGIPLDPVTKGNDPRFLASGSTTFFFAFIQYLAAFAALYTLS